MLRSKPLLLATFLMGTVVLAYLLQQLHTARELNAQLQEQLVQVRSRSSAQRPGWLPRDAFQSPVAQSCTEGGGQADAQGPAGPQLEAQRIATAPVPNLDMLKDAALREAQRLRVRSSLQLMYPDMTRQLGLNAEQANALLDLLTRQQIESLTALPGSGQRGEAATQNLASAAAELHNTQQAELRNLLGDATYQQLQDYQQSTGARQQVSQLNITLAASANPLSDDQAHALVDTIAAEQKQLTAQTTERLATTSRGGQQDFVEESLNEQAASAGRVVDAARSYLSSDQVSALQHMLNQSVAINRAVLHAQHQ